MSKIRIIVLIALLITISILLCNSYIGFRTKSLEEKNPTSYVFHMPMDRLRNLIADDFTKDRSNGKYDLYNIPDMGIRQWDVHDADNPYNALIPEHIFDKPENNQDLYLISAQSPIISYSKIYLKFWKPLEYYAEFQLHCEPSSENKTKIEVITHRSRVHYFSFPLFSGHAYVNVRKVKPTTIEEYEILLRIGRLIGENDMPQLKLPN